MTTLKEEWKELTNNRLWAMDDSQLQQQIEQASKTISIRNAATLIAKTQNMSPLEKSLPIEKAEFIACQGSDLLMRRKESQQQYGTETPKTRIFQR